jgi:hypothetical protein
LRWRSRAAEERAEGSIDAQRLETAIVPASGKQRKLISGAFEPFPFRMHSKRDAIEQSWVGCLTGLSKRMESNPDDAE